MPYGVVLLQGMHLPLVVDLSHQHTYGVIALQGSQDLEGLEKWYNSGSLLEARVTCGGKVTRMSSWQVVVQLDLESPVSWCWDCSYAVKNSIPSENVFRITGSR